MSWVSAAIVLAVAGVAGDGTASPFGAAAGRGQAPTVDSLRHAFERGDLDEVARQGAAAGPEVVERALAAPDRNAQLAGVIAAPTVTGAWLELPALAALAAGPDRRTAIPAAAAARTIAAALARADRPDDVAAEDLADGRGAWLALALRDDRWIELRVTALDVAAELAHADDASALGFDLGELLANPDPALRVAAVALIPQPTAEPLRAALAAAVANDAEPRVALGAAQALCADLVADDPAPVLAALAAAGLDRLRAIAIAPPAGADDGALRDAARCLAADHSPASITALRALATHADPQLRAALLTLRK